MSRITNILIIALCAALSVLAACKKYEDRAAPTDERLNATYYCNDPEAVNYNWGFPGKPDNSLCMFPSSFFNGASYKFIDTIYFSTEYKFARVDTVYFSLDSIDRHRVRFISRSKHIWCDKPLAMTADRFFRATIDSTLFELDSVLLNGQIYCPDDTISGFMTSSYNDKTRIRIDFTVMSDTGSGITFHKGTATKQ